MHGCRRRGRQPARSSAPGRQGPPRPDRSGPAARHPPVRAPAAARTPAPQPGGRARQPPQQQVRPAAPGAPAAAAAARSHSGTGTIPPSAAAAPARRPTGTGRRRRPAAQLAAAARAAADRSRPRQCRIGTGRCRTLGQQVAGRRQVLARHGGVRASAAHRQLRQPRREQPRSGGCQHLLQLRRHLPRQQLRAAAAPARPGPPRPWPTPLRERRQPDPHRVRRRPRALHRRGHHARAHLQRQHLTAPRVRPPPGSRVPSANDSSTATNRCDHHCSPMPPRVLRAPSPPSTRSGRPYSSKHVTRPPPRPRARTAPAAPTSTAR